MQHGTHLQSGVRGEDAVAQLPILAAAGQAAVPAEQWHAPTGVVTLRRRRICSLPTRHARGARNILLPVFAGKYHIAAAGLGGDFHDPRSAGRPSYA